MQAHAKMHAMDLRYPVGEFTWSGANTPEQRAQFIEDIAAAPQKMRKAVAGLTEAQLDTPYRDGGWTVRQVVHHVADSHMNGYTRMKLALTEDNPPIKVYEQDLWAALPDSRLPIDVSLRLLDALHERCATIVKSLSDRDLARTFVHPELGAMTLEAQIQLYGWHSRHHVGHITALRQRQGW